MHAKKKKSISILLIVCMALSLFAGSAFAAHRYFEDAKGHWAEEAINLLAERGIIAGYPDGLSHPDEIITRAEFTALVTRIMELPEPSKSEVTIHFTDIAGHWSEKDVEALIVAGIIQKGDFESKFSPDQPITRMEMIRMLVRAIGKGEHDSTCPCDIGFLDESQLTGGQKAYICTGKHYHIINGYPDGTVRPDSDATRGEAFEMLVDAEKAKEQIKKEEQEKPPVTKPEDKPSGGGSSYVPAPQFIFTLPKTAYTSDEIEIRPTARYVSDVTWSALKNELPVELSDIITGELTANGGKVRFLQAGSITLIATAKNNRGATVTHEQIISIYPVASVALELLQAAHTDTAIAVDLKTENLGGNAVHWSLERDGKEAFLAEALNGELTADGGTILFKEKGNYTLTASITDGLGKVTTATDSIIVYPVAEVVLTLPAVSHTDKTIILITETKEANGLELSYTLAKNGEPVEIGAAVEGNLANGAIRFKEKGVYSLTASIIDATGRVFADTTNITVYPVGSAGFCLPEICHTDKTVMVEAVFGEIGGQAAKWSLLRDSNEIAITEVSKSTLTNVGGELQFKEKGSYVLKAEFTDKAGRTYRYEQSFKVYPVPSVSYSLPRYAHTDSNITVNTETKRLDGLTIEWLVDNTFGFQDWPTYVDGKLTNDGGSIRFKRAGIYELVARVTDETGRVFLFEAGEKCEVLPVLTIGFELPKLAYTDTAIDLRTHGNNNVLPVEWAATKDGKSIPISEAFIGSLTPQGGKITFITHGEYVLTAAMTDYLNRTYSHNETVNILPIVQFAFTVPQAVHYGTEFDVTAKDVQHMGSHTVVWSLEKDDTPAQFQGALGNNGGSISIHDTGTFTLTATITDSAGRVTTHSESITVTNTAPNAPIVTAEPTRDTKDGKFLVNLSASATDPDGDEITLEWDGTTADSYYAVGTHTIRVRAKDIAGLHSDWVSETFTIENSAPTTPVIARTPSGNSVAPGIPVTITATSFDPDGDAVTLVWEGRDTETQAYPLGRNLVRVKAVDSTGAESPWAAIVFFVADSTNGGGMTLTGPDSVILEDGLEGATITEYTFTVPPVDGHSGGDHGRVRGYNKLTGQWDQLDYDTTSNGITFTRTLGEGIYTKLEFYYYTNHNCMYNKSNITYSVNYHFE